ncbi:MAG: cryptochrome/photolyase family protein [Bacteroidia bacterium]
MNQPINIFWHRRDLRITDNAGLYHALKSNIPVLPIFIFDTNILDKLDDKTDARVSFIHQEILKIKNELQKFGSDLYVFYGKPIEVFERITQQFKINAVFTNHDYEPYATQRDKQVKDFLEYNNIEFNTYKDHCIFEKDEVVKDDGKPYTVFTPYSKKWRFKINSFYLKSYPNEKYYNNYLKIEPKPIISLNEMGFEPTSLHFPEPETTNGIIKHYAEKRNFPAINGTSRLGIHFRFGTISIREKARKAYSLSETWVNELIWRDFYMQILWHFPYVATSAFRPEYNNIEWINNENDFDKWCNGQTGYPIVDAGMRELNKTGYMHNRVRMITASFLTKHLLIDWRWGEAYFAKKLLDFDLSANNGGWQWAAGCGTDAAPYFRIFNPALQTEKFDKDLVYTKKWVPELGTPSYPKPIVNHDFARKRCLDVYKKAIGK